jgi:DNA-binding NtrC family response regulator
MASILVIDDDSYFRKLAIAALQVRAHVVFEAPRAKDADALLAQRKFDCIIVDGLLPDADGMSWINRFREKDEETPILFISAFWRNDAKVRALQVSGTLKKPVTASQLVTKVEQSLRNQTGNVAPALELSAQASGELAQLSAAFERDLPKLLRGVSDAVEQLRRTPESAPIRGVAQRRAHQLAGTAGSFGFPKLGEACAQLEDALIGMVHSPATEVTWAIVDDALKALGNAQMKVALSA